MHKHKTYTVEEAKGKIEYYCAYQERCHKEVREKLKQMGMIPEAIDLILVHLIEHNYLNEQRFAEHFAQGKFRIKKWGKQRIIRELKFREISDYSIKKAIELIDDENYLQTLEALTDKRLTTVKESNLFKKKKKVCDYLLYRGWEPHLVYSVVSEKLS